MNFPKTLIVRKLRLRKYNKFITSIRNVNPNLELCLSFLLNSTPCVNIAKLSDNWTFLTSLTINSPVLATCDLEKYSDSIKPKSIFPNLTLLAINHRDYYEIRCNGKEVQQLSKNMTFLLESLSTEILTSFCLWLNAEFCDINACVGRQAYKFEDYLLPKFISRQKYLQKLIMQAPLSLSNKSQSLATFPSNLKTLIVGNDVGILGIGNINQYIQRPALLRWNEEIYHPLAWDEAERYVFWRSLIMSQEQLQYLYIRHQDFLGLAEDLISTLTAKNFSSLVRIYIEATLTGTIDCELFKNCCCLEEFDLYNCLHEPLLPGGIGDLAFVNLNSFPQSLKKLILYNVALDYPEYFAFRNLTSLKILQIMFDVSTHYISLQELPYFHEIVIELLDNDHLDELTIGMIVFGFYDYKFGLDEWYDDEQKIISVRLVE